MEEGIVSLVINPDGRLLRFRPTRWIPCNACLYRESFIEPKLNGNGISRVKSLLWDQKSLAEADPVVSFLSNLRTDQIAERLAGLGIEIRQNTYGSITYFHGSPRQLDEVVKELRENNYRYHED